MLKLAFIFTDSMVLQRNKEIRVWGACEPGAEVVGTFRGATAKTVGKDGSFMLLFPSFEAGKGYELSVKSGTEEIVLKDVAVGEVWIAGGQSNMEMPLAVSKNGMYELQFHKNDDVRFITVARRHQVGQDCWGWPFISQKACDTPWKIAGGTVGRELSTVAYTFAKRVTEQENVPVGIISCNWGGSSVFFWIPRKDMMEDEKVYPFVKDHFESLDSMKPEDYRPSNKAYIDDLEFRGPTHPVGQGYDFVDHYANPELFSRFGGTNETMFQTICPYSVKGVIWYQGESDAHETAQCYDRYMAGMNLLRKTWMRDLQADDLYFITTLLPGYDNGAENGWCAVRQALIDFEKENENVYCVNAIDCGEKHNIHPFEKQAIGERMAGCALSECYGHDLLWRYPEFEKAYIRKDGTVCVEFTNSYDYLIGDNVAIGGFEVETEKGWEEVLFAATGNVAWSKEPCKNAKKVRYLQHNFVHAHLFNSLGLPAMPFMEKELL